MIGLTTLAAFVAGAGLSGIGTYALSQREESEPELQMNGPSDVDVGDTVTYTAEYDGEGINAYSWTVDGVDDGRSVFKQGENSNQLTVTVDSKNTRISVHAYNIYEDELLGWDMKVVPEE